MNDLTTSDPIAAIDAAPVPFDLYREVHKGLRLALFDLTVAVGSADGTDAAARSDVVDHVGRLVEMLHAHHGHEDTFIQPVLVAADPTLAAIVDEGHAETDADIVEIELRAEKLAGADGGDAVAAGLELYGSLALFAARYLAHMALEEGAVMSTLRAADSTAELFGVEMAIRSTIPPPRLCEFATVMLPAMNIDERTAMLGGMQAGAPPEIFELVRATAEAALSPADYRAVADRIGVA